MRRYGQTRWAAAATAMWCIAASVLAGPPDLTSPKAALRSLQLALQSGDAQAIRQVMDAADEPQRALVGAVADLLLAGKRLTDAAKEKFGAAADDLNAAELGKFDLAQLEAAQVKESGDNASLLLPGRSRPLTFRRSNGQWRLMVADWAGGADQPMPRQVAVVQQLAQAMSRCAEELAANQYATVQEAQQAIHQQLQAVMLESLKGMRPASRPATTRTVDEGG